MYINRMAVYAPKLTHVLSMFLTRSSITFATEYDRCKVYGTQHKPMQILNQSTTQKMEDLTETFNEQDEEYVRVIIMGPMW